MSVARNSRLLARITRSGGGWSSLHRDMLEHLPDLRHQDIQAQVRKAIEKVEDDLARRLLDITLQVGQNPHLVEQHSLAKLVLSAVRSILETDTPDTILAELKRCTKRVGVGKAAGPWMSLALQLAMDAVQGGGRVPDEATSERVYVLLQQLMSAHRASRGTATGSHLEGIRTYTASLRGALLSNDVEAAEEALGQLVAERKALVPAMVLYRDNRLDMDRAAEVLRDALDVVDRGLERMEELGEGYPDLGAETRDALRMMGAVEGMVTVAAEPELPAPLDQLVRAWVLKPDRDTLGNMAQGVVESGVKGTTEIVVRLTVVMGANLDTGGGTTPPQSSFWDAVASEVEGVLREVLMGRGAKGRRTIVASRQLRGRLQDVRPLFLPDSLAPLAGARPFLLLVMRDHSLLTGTLLRVTGLFVHLVAAQFASKIFEQIARRRRRDFARKRSRIFVWNVLFGTLSALGMVGLYAGGRSVLRSMNGGVAPRYSLGVVMPVELATSWLVTNLAAFMTSAALMDAKGYMLMTRDFEGVGQTLTQVVVVVAAVFTVVPSYLAIRLSK